MQVIAKNKFNSHRYNKLLFRKLHMPFDKYLFEKYIKDCIVEILSPNKGTGFWVLPDGHILTCYHILKTNWGIEKESSGAEVRYHGKNYFAVLDKEHSKKELDIAVLIVKEIHEKIHFVPLGEADLNTEVHAFGYRVGFNGYHISGIIRQGQETPDAGLVYNFETNQHNDSKTDGMSGSPIYDINKKKVVGLQYGQEEAGPSICYVHPTAKVYKLWPELRTKNFNSIRKDFNIYFMTSEVPRSIFVLSMALLENALRKDSINNAEQITVDIIREKVNSESSKNLTHLYTKKIMSAILRANRYLYNQCEDRNFCNISGTSTKDSTSPARKSFHNHCINREICRAFMMPTSDLLSIQAALNDLPKTPIQEDAIKTISENLRLDYPELTEKQIEAGVNSYRKYLEKELMSVKDFIFSTVTQVSRQIDKQEEENENKINEALVNLEKYGAQRGIYMALDDAHMGFGVSIGDGQDKETHAQILMLEEVLFRESSHLSSELNNWQPDKQPSYFLQQVHNRINRDKEMVIGKVIEKLLTKRREPWLAKYGVPIAHPLPRGRKSFDALRLTFTIDGKHIISSTLNDQTLYLWNVENGQFSRDFQGRASGIFCVAITADEKNAIFASSDKVIRKWDIVEGKCLPISKVENDHIWDISIIPKTQHAILACANGILCRRDLESGKSLMVFKGHKEICSNIAMSSDGEFFISASDDNTLRLWRTDTEKPLRTFVSHLDKVFSVAIIPGRHQIISASADSTLRLWDISTGKCRRIFKGHSSSVHGVVITPDGKHAVSASADKTLRLWDTFTGRCLAVLTGDEPFKCCAITPRDSLIAVGDQAGKIQFIEVRNNNGKVNMART